MKNKHTSIFFAVIGIALLTALGSCKKDDDNGGSDGTSVSKAGLLTSSGWVTTSIEATFPDPIGTMDVFATFDDCEKDDIMIFKSDKSIVADEGATKCDPNDPQTESAGTWELTSNDTKLRIDDAGYVDEFDIITLTSSQMSIQITEYDSGLMADITYKMTLSH
ncbi:MAG: lipocalin family protein [Salibacteraceae bacterium]